MAKKIKQDLMQNILSFKKKRGDALKLAVILVGSDPASQVYVAKKREQCQEVGIDSIRIDLDQSCTQTQLEQTICRLNGDFSVNGILVQLPLPFHLDTHTALNLIDPCKDVDGLTSLNMGKMIHQDASALLPCTPQGILHLINSTNRPLEGLKALVIGRSRLVGIPTMHLLTQENCTVTLAHSRSLNLPNLCKESDIIVAACGQPQLIQESWIKANTIVIDVGIHRLNTGNLVGDVAAHTITDDTISLSPVPGGVGPLTVAFLLKNTLKAATLKK